MDAENRVVLVAIIATLILVLSIIFSSIYNAHDYSSGKTIMESGVIVDKEHVHKINDGSHSHKYYFIVKEGDNEIEAEVDEAIYKLGRLGTRVIVDRRVGGMSNQVIKVSARMFEGAEAK